MLTHSIILPFTAPHDRLHRLAADKPDLTVPVQSRAATACDTVK
jgi:hypothetical protein